jgi:hypothetical protein
MTDRERIEILFMMRDDALADEDKRDERDGIEIGFLKSGLAAGRRIAIEWILAALYDIEVGSQNDFVRREGEKEKTA